MCGKGFFVAFRDNKRDVESCLKYQWYVIIIKPQGICALISEVVMMERKLMNYARILGNNVNLELKLRSIDISELAENVGFSLSDVHRLIEGRLFLPPMQLDRIAEFFGITQERLTEERELSEYHMDVYGFERFKYAKNQELVLDLIDMYADLAESL